MGYERLTKDFKEKLLAPWWGRCAAQVKEQYGYDLSKEGLELRHRAQTDGFWLAKEVLGYQYFSDCHKEIFTDFFVKKDPAAVDFKAFAEADEGLHDRLLMLCRGGFKSTADIVDCIQWFSCFPDIRINIMTGTSPLAEEFTGLIKGHIALNSDGSIKTRDDGKLKLYQVLFPEHCEIDPGLKPEWVTPARRREVAGPTIRATSLDKNTTGTHCDILKIDDGTNAENTRTTERIKSVNTQISMARRLCEPYGYKDRIGTPYHVNDNLMSTIKDEEERDKKGLPPQVKILLHPAYTAKPGFENHMPDQLTEDNIVLWFPERITLKYLQNEYADALKTDPASFFSQFLLDLNKAYSTKFRRDVMIAATVDTLPTTGIVFQAWDLAYSEKQTAKYTVGMCGLFTTQGVYIVDMVRGRFGEHELPEIMANFAHKWKPRRVAVEDSMGARWLKRGIDDTLAKLRTNVSFEFISLGKGTKANSKEIKAMGPANLLGSRQLFFWKAIDTLQDIYNELEAFPKGQFKDIVCSLSLLVNHFSNFAYVAPQEPIYINERMERIQRDMVYGLGAFAPKVQDQTMISAQGGEQDLDYDPLAQSGLF